MKTSLTYPLALGAIILYSSPTVLHADWLDRMDQQYEDTFQKTDVAFDRALKEGVKELDHELADIWGEARNLPEPKVWVGYSKDRQTRIIVDYERGEMAIEGFNKSEDELRGEMQDILLEDSQKLDERAILRDRLIKKSKEFWRDQQTPTRERVKATQDTKPRVINWRPRHELSRLIEPKSQPVFVSRKATFNTGKAGKISRLSLNLRTDRDQVSAQSLADPVSKMAKKYNLPRSLILSVIKNESAFNPRARSHANALGLMQLVPTSGGKEAYSYLMGKDLTPGVDVLYDPYENIRLGATYLHLLNTRYFGKVKDEKARQYLIIAAYNTGAGNVAKAFTGKMKLRTAIRKINRMSADQIFSHLRQHLPYDETKTYLARVSKDTQTFADWDQT
ncbi:MAG: DUF3393 domain-containing protein [Methylocystaceae bacterium]|nr:DUF3393 domain-containing protein [Methylocystaceae bacterium]